MNEGIKARCTLDNLIMGTSIQNKVGGIPGSMLLVACTNERTAVVPHAWAKYLDGLRGGDFVRVEIPVGSWYDKRAATQLVRARIMRRPYKNQHSVFSRGEFYNQTFYVGAAPMGRGSGLMDIL